MLDQGCGLVQGAVVRLGRQQGTAGEEADRPSRARDAEDLRPENRQATYRGRQKRRRWLVAALNDAQRAELEGEEFVVEFASEAKHSRDTLAKSENAKALREACTAVLGREVGIRFSIKDGNADDNQTLSPEEDVSRAKQKARQQVAQNPSVQQVLRAFGGEIVDIKMR